MGNILSQCAFIPAPTLTEKNLPDQTGKVHIVTGGYAGCGLELVRILYQRNATVYVAGRSASKASSAIAALKSEFPDSAGRLEFLKLDLADQSSIKASAAEFMSKESRLDVLTNNAGVMTPPARSTDAHGHEQQMGTNCLGPWLFTQCLLPILKSTAASSPPDSVRVTWAASLVIYAAPRGGVSFDAATGQPAVAALQDRNYAQSKAGNVLLAAEFGRRHARDGIVSVSWNPGNLRTELQRHVSAWRMLLLRFLLYDARFGGYTELYAGWSKDITTARNGAFIVPWGRVGSLRSDLLAAQKTEEEGGSGTARRLWEWCEKECGKYL